MPFFAILVTRLPLTTLHLLLNNRRNLLVVDHEAKAGTGLFIHVRASRRRSATIGEHGPSFPDKLDELVFEVSACWDDVVKIVPPDDEHAFVTLYDHP